MTRRWIAFAMVSALMMGTAAAQERPDAFPTSSLLKNLNSSAFVLRFSSSYKRSVRFGSECSRLVATLSL